jgi:peptidoglycan-associated lipoprotein
MRRQLAFLVLCSGFTVLGSGCATKSFVQEQLSATETKLTQRVDTQETKLREQETKLRETSDRAGASRQAINEVGALASDAKTRAVTAHDSQARLSQRLADRNKFRLMETRSVYFESGKTDIRTQDMNELEDAAKALKADANAVLELQGFADSRGNDRQNNELARERVDAVIRYLVERHGIELRQLHAVAMGKVALAAGEKPSTEGLAKARRVDIRLLAPWSSWEDAQTHIDHTGPAQTSTVDPSAEAASPKSIEDAIPKTSARPGHDRAVLKNDGPGKALREFLKTISRKELGGED